jgi:hypothetical protein
VDRRDYDSVRDIDPGRDEIAREQRAVE